MHRPSHPHLPSPAIATAPASYAAPIHAHHARLDNTWRRLLHLSVAVTASSTAIDLFNYANQPQVLCISREWLLPLCQLELHPQDLDIRNPSIYSPNSLPFLVLTPPLTVLLSPIPKMTQLGDYPPWERLHRLYDLPNPPSATIFSFRKGAQHRSWLPDFSASPDPVHELHQFVDNVIWPVISSATYIQLKIGLGLIACLMALVIAIMIRKIRQRSFWIFHRLVRPTGTFILPNSLVVFSLFELIFAACLFIG